MNIHGFRNNNRLPSINERNQARNDDSNQPPGGFL